jgi:hypothetical protein
MASIGFAVDSDSAGSSIITVAQPDETRGSIRRLGSLMRHYGLIAIANANDYSQAIEKDGADCGLLSSSFGICTSIDKRAYEKEF